MSANFCQKAVASSLQLGKGGAGVKSLSGTAIATRNAADTALVTLEVATPTADAHAATKKYVDDLVSLSVTWKEAARVCATVNITIAAPGAVIDGVTLSVGDRVVLKAQTTVTENGIRVFQGAATPMTLPADWATGSDQSGSVVSIQEGTCADELYIASADPAVVGTNNPLFLLIATVSTGVTSVTDAVAVPSGGSSLIGAGPTGAVTLNVLDDSARISIVLAANVITFDIVASSIGTAQLAANAVTNAKLAVGAACSFIWGDISFTDAGSTVTLASGQAPVPASSRVVNVKVVVGTAFGPTAVTVDVQVGAVSVMGTDKSDLNIAGQYDCDDAAAQTGTVTAVVGVAAGLTAGAARIMLCYVREA